MEVLTEGNDIDIPGWVEHNGTTLTRRSRILNKHLTMNAYPNKPCVITHNRFYIPEDAKFIRFDRKYNSDYPGKFYVLINGVKLTDSERSFEKKEASFVEECINISNFRDQVIKLTFRLENTTPVFSDILIDNVELSKKGCEKYSTLFLFDLSGSMNDYGGGTTPKLQQAKEASKATLSAMRTSNQGVGESSCSLWIPRRLCHRPNN